MRIVLDCLNFEKTLWLPWFGGYFLHIEMPSAGSSFPMVNVAVVSINVDHHSYFTTTDHDELLVGWNRRALSTLRLW